MIGWLDSTVPPVTSPWLAQRGDIGDAAHHRASRRESRPATRHDADHQEAADLVNICGPPGVRLLADGEISAHGVRMP